MSDINWQEVIQGHQHYQNIIHRRLEYLRDNVWSVGDNCKYYVPRHAELIGYIVKGYGAPQVIEVEFIDYPGQYDDYPPITYTLMLYVDELSNDKETWLERMEKLCEAEDIKYKDEEIRKARAVLAKYGVE